MVYAQDFFYHEFYLTSKDLDLFLQSVPIFEDFDSVKDKQSLMAYTQKFQAEKGIKLERHRVIIVAQKI